MTMFQVCDADTGRAITEPLMYGEAADAAWFANKSEGRRRYSVEPSKEA
jgi:hypothetical protein